MFASTPAFQVPATIFRTLPRELVERILRLLDTRYVLTCKLVNREFNEIIQSSIFLQYVLACKAAGVIDNPRSSLSYAERLEALLKREDAWRMLKPVFETTIKVNHDPYVIYGLTEGVFVLDDRNLKDLHYCLLPSSPQDNPQWNRIQCHGAEEGIILKFAIAVYEHDLIIKIVSSDIGNQADTRYSLDLVLLKFSTGEYHPLARHPRIHVQRSPEARPRVKPGIVGDNFALIQHETTENPYSDLVFVSPEILLVLNPILWNFEVWHLPPSHPNPKPPVQILALQIPAISRDDYWLGNICFHGEPNPFLHSMPYFPPRPFFPSRENSIITTNLWLQSLQESRSDSSYTHIMPRRALLDTIQKWTSPSLCERIEDLPIWFTKEVTVHKIVDPDDGSVRLDAQSKLVSTVPHPRPPPRTPGSPTVPASPTSPTSHISADSGSSSISSGSSTTSSTTQYNFPQVQWADWGPPISRWFQENEERWIMGSTGQRYAFWVPNPRDRSKLTVSVADFNQHNVRRNTDVMARLRAGEGKNRGANDNKEQVEEEELERLDHEGVFSEDIYMGLKCVIYHAPDEYDFTMGLMDEQRLLGLNVNSSNVESVKVLHFG
ncbi:hypothetical protein M378DRAFT_27594 [Amanita muscaria Koide BX008]|uniref:F-box domain-containing protein n=1 Tax=Amanita muscaria (strain Koide BX008) TaxID=946122 RepID=A0A0C2S6J3_AMAMK|nr:hypothetical protein M378DRAFT_27594 [Amanita muscaria Koide BX008]